MTTVLGLDIGSNSVGSAWIDLETGHLTTGVSVFPAGVEESDEKRGDPKNAKRRMTRRTRITLARRALRKRELRMRLIEVGLLPSNEAAFKKLLESTDPWILRQNGLNERLSPFEFGRVLLHLAQRRGALGLKLDDAQGDGEPGDDDDDGKVRKAINAVRERMRERNAPTFGAFMASIRADRVHAITTTDKRPSGRRVGPREYRDAIRNKAGSYEHCADRPMLRDEFAVLWDAQKKFGGDTANVLTDELRLALDDERGDATWRHKGLLFGQRRQSWDLGTLGRCVLEPTERCAPHADMYASRYLVVETVNSLRVLEHGREPRPLTPEERARLIGYLSGPLGTEKGRRNRGQTEPAPDRPKTTVSVTDLRELMGWGRATKTTRIRFNIENDPDRTINTDWFSREVIHGAITPEHWAAMPERVRDGLNRVILRYNPDEDGDAAKLMAGATGWAGLSKSQAETLIAAWRRRPRLDKKRLNMSRRAVRNLLAIMDRPEPWPDPQHSDQPRWLTQIEARKRIAADPEFRDVTTGRPLDQLTRDRYATGAKGATARDRYYMSKHLLRKDGELVYGPDGEPLAEPPPAPVISNPVVRKAIHEVRRHLIAYMSKFGRVPDEVYVELAREARMGKMDADRLLFKNRLRNRIRRDIIDEFDLHERTSTQQRAALDRVVLCVQQGGVCPLCGQAGLSSRAAAAGDGCEVAHIIPRASGGHNGLGNIVLAHTKCNRDMGRRTPRQFWEASLKGGFEEGMRGIEGIFGNIERPKLKDSSDITGDALWTCYFTWRDDAAKIEQFKKEVKDVQDMTARQEAATKHATRQVMAYLADALYDGKGLPERGGERRIFTTDGMWTSRLRREWGLLFDPHNAKAKGLTDSDEHLRREKNRGDHRHHAIDAAVIALCSRSVQIAWEERERQADRTGVNTADEESLESHRRNNPLPPPACFGNRDRLRQSVQLAVFGNGEVERAVCHRPVKRKLIGALHEETLFGPVLDEQGNLTDTFTARKSVLDLDPKHLRLPRKETEREAIERLAVRRSRQTGTDMKSARKWARSVVSSPAFVAAVVDPPPEKSGLVRDLALRTRLRQCLIDAGNDPDSFTTTQIKKLVESDGLKHASGVPIRTVVLLRTMSDPVIVDRKRLDHTTGRLVRDDDPASKRAYLGGNNHHIEIRVDARGKWSGHVVTAFEAAQRKLARLCTLRKAAVPTAYELRRIPAAERGKFSPAIRAVELAHPLVDRRDDDAKGGRFVMSLCEGEMLFMQHKQTRELGYFVVAKLDKPQSVVLVPHWDARSATERKDSMRNKVPDSKRDQFAVTPNDLKTLAPPGDPHARKVRVSPLGEVHTLEKD